MELVVLQDIQNSFGSNWVRVANSTGIEDIHIGDRFRERGFGPGAEELEVAGVDISPVGGMSRLFFNRGGNATKPEVHRLGAVLEQVGIKLHPTEPPILTSTSGAVTVTNQPTNGSASADAPILTEISRTEDTSSTAPLMTPVKRKRGRPPGSKNRTHMEVALPAGFE